MTYDLAQVNIARLREPLGSDRMASFVAALAPINALAEAAPGFVWRLEDGTGDATAIQAFGWDAAGSAGVIINMSTWRDVASLSAFTYGTEHVDVLRQRRQWFHAMAEAWTTCWWVPAGHRPTTDEAEQRIRLLREAGPTPAAFTLKIHFPPPGVAAGQA